MCKAPVLSLFIGTVPNVVKANSFRKLNMQAALPPRLMVISSDSNVACAVRICVLASKLMGAPVIMKR